MLLVQTDTVIGSIHRLQPLDPHLMSIFAPRILNSVNLLIMLLIQMADMG
jgi:hypothetical protein